MLRAYTKWMQREVVEVLWKRQFYLNLWGITRYQSLDLNLPWHLYGLQNFLVKLRIISQNAFCNFNQVNLTVLDQAFERHQVVLRSCVLDSWKFRLRLGLMLDRGNILISPWDVRTQPSPQVAPGLADRCADSAYGTLSFSYQFLLFECLLLMRLTSPRPPESLRVVYELNYGRMHCPVLA